MYRPLEFSYAGTGDLSAVQADTAVGRLRDALYSDKFVDFLQQATGIELSRGRLDLSSHIYRRGDYLGCHDDDIEEAEEGRRIAFILYLSKDWKPEYGGALSLYSM